MHQITEKHTRTQIVLASFFAIAAIICLVAAVTLLYPETPLSIIWWIKPDEFAQLIQLRPWTGIGFLLLSGFMGAAAWGCLQRRLWGWRMAVLILAANGLGDLAQIFAGRILEGTLGLIIAGALVFWLTRQSVKAAFH